VRGNGNHERSSELKALQARDIDSNTLGNVVQTDAKSGDKSDTADLTLLLSLCVNNFLRLGRTVVLCGRVLVISFFGLVAFFAIRVCVIGFIVVVAVREEVRCKAEKEHTNKELQ
jgi:hypothetical protein